MFKLILISAIILGIGFAGIAIKIWALKDGEFDGTCASRKILGKSCACGGDSSCDSDKNLTQNPDHKEAYFNDSPNIIVKKVS